MKSKFKTKEEFFGETLTVDGIGTVHVKCPFTPSEVEIDFIDQVPPKAGCNQTSEDSVSIEIIDKGVEVAWKTSSPREVAWTAKKS